MLILGMFSIASGALFNGVTDLGPIPAHWFAHFLDEDGPEVVGWIAVASMVLALGGVLAAIAIYGMHVLALERMPRAWKFANRVLDQGYYMDYLYETLVVRRALFRGVFMASDWLDRKVVDGTVDFVGWTGRNAGKFVAQLQTGQVQVYGVGVSAGVIILLWAFLARS
jgi:NADH-quinone oxidoreductase subunit L